MALLSLVPTQYINKLSECRWCESANGYLAVGSDREGLQH